MHIEGSVVLVTGANRGLGLAFARELLARGASKVYAGVRDPASVTVRGLVPIQLDVTDAGQIAAAAEQLTDVTIVVNNAGIGGATTALATPLDEARAQLEVNFLGTLAVSQAFAPILAANGGGALVNMLSALSWISFPQHATYAASKSAQWSVTNALRVELRGQGTLVVGVHAGYLDTDMTAGITDPKTAPEEVARQVALAIETGEEEVLVDETSQQVKAGLAAPIAALYAGVQAGYDAATAGAAA